MSSNSELKTREIDSRTLYNISWPFSLLVRVDFLAGNFTGEYFTGRCSTGRYFTRRYLTKLVDILRFTGSIFLTWSIFYWVLYNAISTCFSKNCEYF